MINVVVIVAVLIGLAGVASGDESSAPGTPPVIIEIVGGFGHLTSLELKGDGTFTWRGWEPGRRVASIRTGRMNAKDLGAIVGVANRVRERIPGHEFSGGEQSYVLVLRGSDGQDREIEIRHAQEDQRPAELKRLLDSLWATRVRREERSEPEHAGERG